MAGEDVPAVAVRMDDELRALAQERQAAEADRVDVDDRAVAACPRDEIVVAHHLVGIGMRDAEGVHHLLAGLLLVLEDQRHDRLHALGERRIGRAHQLLVVLDEVDAGVDQLADHLGRLVRPQPQRRLDDGADDRPPLDAGQPPAAVDAELRSGMGAAELLRQLHVDHADAGQPLDRERAADGDRHQRREVGADRLDRKADIDIGAFETGRGRLSGKRRRLRRLQQPDRQHPRRDPRLQFLRLARQRRRSAGRLVAGDLGSQSLDASGRLDPVGQDDHFVLAFGAELPGTASSFRQTGIMSIPSLQAESRSAGGLTLDLRVC